MEKKLQIQKVYSLSPMQEGMLFHAELDKTSSAYFEQTAFTVKGRLNVELFEKSFNMLISRHDVLRTIFFYKNVQKLSQCVLAERPAHIHFEDISHLEESSRSSYIEDFKIKDREKGFDLSKDILIRISILKTGEESYKLIWSFHHILMDGWCIGIINKEILEIYSSLKNNTPLRLGKAPVYKDYIQWLEKQDKEKAGDYWSLYLKDYENRVVVPKTGLDRGAGKYNKEEMCFLIDREITEELANIARKNDATLNTVFQAVWGIILQRYNNTNDVIFGAVMSGRSSEVEGIEEMVGLFINTVPVRVKCEDNTSFTALLRKMQEDALLSERYSYYPLSQIQGASSLKNALLDHIVVYENYPIQEALKDLGSSSEIGFVIEDVESFEQTNYDFNIAIVPGSEMKVMFKFNSNVYDKAFIESIGRHINETVREVVQNPNAAIGDIEIMSSEEKTEMLFDFNNTKTAYPRDKTLDRLFREQAEKTPDSIAVVFEDKRLTYKELNDKANRLARVLRKKGVAAGSIVGMIVGRSLEMIVGIIGILKAGGAYLPIDPEYPAERIAGILEDSGTTLVLIQSTLVKETPLTGLPSIEAIVMEDIWDILDCESPENLEPVNSSHDLAYVMYTSGSTGKPKGNMITHYNISRVVKNTNYIEITDKDTLLQLSNYAFDGSTFDIYGALLNGARLVIVHQDILLDVAKLSELIRNEGITLFFVTTALFNALTDVNIECFKHIRKVLFGGERVSVRHVSRALEYMGPGRIVHVYGPTESTVFATFYNVDSIDESLGTIPIGAPLANTEIYVLNRRGKLQPIGIPGELCIAGDGLASGYLNRSELTGEKFVQNPFVPGERLYKTGDLVRWLSGCSIEFIDRIDTQVKLRGFRIELGEIEAQLLNHEDIREAVVLCSQDEAGSKFLCAYVVADKELSVVELREHLSGELPDYMIPSYFSRLKSMPLTPNGKIDKKVLENFEKMDAGVEYAAPRNDIENTLVEVWQDILGVKGIGINDNYFSRGGDSIKAIQIASRLQKEQLKMEIRDLFQHPTIGELSSCIKVADKKIEQAMVTGEVLLTPIQKWFFQKRFTDMHHFNHSVMLHSVKGFDENIIKKVFTKLVAHHDALRMVYKFEDSGVTQFNRGIEGNLFELKTVDLSNEANCSVEIKQEANRAQAGINLSEGPLVKLRLFKTPDGDHLLIVIHHLVIDGVSWRIILEDFAVGYMQALKGQPVVLQDKSTSFKAWAQKLNTFGAGEKIKDELEYWKTVMENEIMPLPKDGKARENRLKDSAEINIQLSEDETTKLLKDVNQTYNTEINDILISALALAFKEWCGCDRLLIDLEGHGRENIIDGVDINRTVGWFSSVYPVVLDMRKRDDLPYCIKSVKDELNRIPNNGIGHGILEFLSPDTIKASVDSGRKPEISFNYLGQFDRDIKTEVFNISGYLAGNPVSPELERSYTLDINGFVKDNRLALTLTYNREEYREETAAALAQSYKTCILSIIDHCMNKGDTELTPTDFLYNKLSIEALDDITGELEDILD